VAGLKKGVSWWREAPFWGSIGALLSSVAFGLFFGAIGVVVGIFGMYFFASFL